VGGRGINGIQPQPNPTMTTTTTTALQDAVSYSAAKLSRAHKIFDPWQVAESSHKANVPAIEALAELRILMRVASHLGETAVVDKIETALRPGRVKATETYPENKWVSTPNPTQPK